MKLGENNYLMRWVFSLSFIRIGQKLWIFYLGTQISKSPFLYRDSYIFLDTLDKFFMVNWFTWPWSLLNTKFTLILYPHILKISLRLSNYGSRYSLADNQRSNSEITHPHCLAFMREKIDASSVLSLNNLIKINTWILTWCRNQI